ncbi:MAG: histidine phosphatase family protein [Methylocystaceae bacterium]|nr:histidine phosphatase family protein [Methylocystaceae bacterium]
MKNLLLLRHAKSSWSNPGLLDFERPLNNRGQSAADQMALYLSKNLPLPDHVICSTAQRTRETLNALLKAYAHEMTIDLSRDLYMAPPSVMMGLIHAVPDQVETLILISHNPGMEELALSLSKPVHSPAMEDMLYKYPTAACAHLSFEGANWTDVRMKSASLEAFIKPRDI